MVMLVVVSFGQDVYTKIDAVTYEQHGADISKPLLELSEFLRQRLCGDSTIADNPGDDDNRQTGSESEHKR